METEADGAYAAGAVVANVVYVPGKAILCGLGTVVGMGLLLATFGSGYQAASAIGHEGCAGRWVLRGDDLRPSPSSEWSVLMAR
jgi:hypothetical protein